MQSGCGCARPVSKRLPRGGLGGGWGGGRGGGRDGRETPEPGPSAKTQTVQPLCQAFGVLPWMRDALPLVFAGDELIAVADLWLDARWCAAADAPGLGIAWNNAPLVT